MNAPFVVPAKGEPAKGKTPNNMPKRRGALAKVRRRDQQFLPGALEILETPPAPLAKTMILVICLFFVVALVWAYFGRIDIVAVAQGKIQPTGRVKTLQSLETGRVKLDHVHNGQQVKAGEILVELDQRDASAERGSIAADLDAYRAEALRRHVAIALARRATTSPGPKIDAFKTDPLKTDAHKLDPLKIDLAKIDLAKIDWPAETSAPVRAREERVLDADVAQLAAQIGGIVAQITQKRAERTRLVAMSAAERDLIATLQERVTMRATLVQQNAGSKASLIDATETLATQKATLAQEIGQILEADANIDVLANDQKRVFRTFIADNAQKLDEAERQIASLSEKLIRADTRIAQLTLRSPIDGVVQASSVTTIGQVVTSGEELMRIVPDGAALEIESYLPNKDIGFVTVGQKAVVKIESFPFTRYGTIEAIVTRVARDAIPEPDAAQVEQDPSRLRRANMPAGADRVQNLVFPVTLKPLQSTIDVDGQSIPLGTGMAVTTEIRTGSRRIIDYIVSPLIQVKSEAMKER